MVEASSFDFCKVKGHAHLISKNELQLCDRELFLLFSTLQ